MLLKCCGQYVSKFGKISSAHRTWEGQFSSQSQRRAMPKHVQTTAQLCSFHMLPRLCSKSLKLGFSSTWTGNFQDVQAGFQKGRGTRGRIAQHLLDHRVSKRIPENMCFTDYTKVFDHVDLNELWKILKEMRISDHLTCLLRNLYAGQETAVRTGCETTDWFQIGKGVH